MELIFVFGVGILVVIALCGILDRLNKILILLASIHSQKTEEQPR
jgi:hypothetical protein